MTSVHTERHPLAERYVKPSNAAILKKFGIVRVEDWADRVDGETWPTLRTRGSAQIERYVELAHAQNAPMGPGNLLEVVRCHLQSTGDLVLLHDEWIKNGVIVA